MYTSVAAGGRTSPDHRPGAGRGRAEEADRDTVSTELLAQEAGTRGIEVSDEDIDAELNEVAEQNQVGSAEELLAAVEKQGVTEEQARSQVGTQLMVEELAEDEDGSIEPTEKELGRLDPQAGSSRSVRPEDPAVRQGPRPVRRAGHVTEDRQVAGTLAEDLRKDADITINL